MTSQAEIAMHAAGAGWFHPDDLIPDGEEVSDQVRELCKEHDLEFGQLYAEARRQITEGTEDPDEGDILLVHEETARRMFRILVAAAAELIADDADTPLNAAARALQAAQETENEQMIETATAHYDSELVKVIDGAGLAPVVEALEGMIIAKNLDEAGYG
jgi:hypothetical protein